MSYVKQGFVDGQTLKASNLITIENGIIANDTTATDIHREYENMSAQYSAVQTKLSSMTVSYDATNKKLTISGYNTL